MMNTSSNTDIIFVASNSTHLKMFSRVIQSLTMKRQNLNIRTVTLSKYYNQIDADLERKLNLPNLTELDSGRITDYWSSNTINKLLLSFNASVEVNNILQKFQPKLILLGNDTGIVEQLFIRQAKTKSVTTILLQDGMLNSLSYSCDISTPLKLSTILFNMFFGISKNRIYGLTGTDFILTMGNYTNKLLINSNVKAGTIETVGQPRFKLVDQKLKSQVLNTNEPIRIRNILWITQPLRRYKLVNEKVATTLDDFLIESISTIGKDFEWNIFVHPSDTPQYYEDLLRNLADQGHKITFSFGKDVYEILNSIDCILTYTSTVALEGMINKKPIIFVNPFYENDYYHFKKIHELLSASSPTDIKKLISRYQEEINFINEILTGYQSIISDHISSIDNESAKKIAEFMLKII